MTIHDKIKQLLANTEKPVIFEIGSEMGHDTLRLAKIKNATVYAFEPDPRNRMHYPNHNIRFTNKALSNKEGYAPFYLSDKSTGTWTSSSSLKKPKEHLVTHPDIVFNEVVTVPITTLDFFCAENGIKKIDLIWMDVQGAEADVLEGAAYMLPYVKYIFTEYSNKEEYEGQKTLPELLAMLGSNWQIVEQYDYDVLLVNISL